MYAAGEEEMREERGGGTGEEDKAEADIRERAK